MLLIRAHIGKILGLAVGILLAGILGGFLGLVVGLMLDRVLQRGLKFGGGSRGAGGSDGTMDMTDFILSSLVLAAAVVKSDDETSDLELSYIHTFLAEQFGTEHVEEYMDILHRSIQQNFDLQKVTQQIHRNTDYETRLQILYFLFGIANADFGISPKEVATIKIISIHLGLSIDDYDSIKAMYYNELDAYYQILEITPVASDADVRKAYQEMAKKYHPDKVAHLGEAVQKTAHEKYVKVQEAYDAIKKGRGFR